MNKKHIASIYAVAGQLDRLGHHRLADRLDKIAAEATMAFDSLYSGPSASWGYRSTFPMVMPGSIKQHFDGLAFSNDVNGLARYLKQQGVQDWQRDKVIKAISSDPDFQKNTVRLALIGTDPDDVGRVLKNKAEVERLISDLVGKDPDLRAAVQSAIDASPEMQAVKGVAGGTPALPDTDMDMLPDEDVLMVEEKPAARTLPEDSYRAMSNVEVGAPGSKTRSSPKGHALLDTLILSAISLLVGAAAMFGFSRSKDDKQLKADLEATVDLLNTVKDKADPVKRQKSLEYTAGKVKLLKSKLGQPGYMADSAQKSALDKLDTQLDNLIASLRG
jgi:hypothetical protein